MLSAVFAAVTAILAKVGVEGIDSNLATAIRTTVILLLSWAIAFAVQSPMQMQTISLRNWVYLALSGLATGLSWLCYFRALQLGPASGVAPIDKLSVVFVIILAALFLGEHLTPAKIIGGALIFVGAVVLVFE